MLIPLIELQSYHSSIFLMDEISSIKAKKCRKIQIAGRRMKDPPHFMYKSTRTGLKYVQLENISGLKMYHEPSKNADCIRECKRVRTSTSISSSISTEKAQSLSPTCA